MEMGMGHGNWAAAVPSMQTAGEQQKHVQHPRRWCFKWLVLCRGNGFGHVACRKGHLAPALAKH
eukprot:358778-Pelagomonas_calceolata.AAC.1